MDGGYLSTRSRLETYFDRTALAAWEALTSDAPVSRIRRTVREGRDRMRETILGRLPADLSGARVLDAGCGTGQMAVELARRGAHVTAVDISPQLIGIARQRVPQDLAHRIAFAAGDMLDPAHGRFDFAVAMDSLIHYAPADAAAAVARLGRCTGSALVFTLAPRTTLLSAMHLAGQLFPRGDRSPAIVPVRPQALVRAVARQGGGRVVPLARVARGFYISQAMELRP